MIFLHLYSWIEFAADPLAVGGCHSTPAEYPGMTPGSRIALELAECECSFEQPKITQTLVIRDIITHNCLRLSIPN